MRERRGVYLLGTSPIMVVVPVKGPGTARKRRRWAYACRGEQ